MVYTVTYRDANGNRAEKAIEAKTRNELFALLKEKEISPIRVDGNSAVSKHLSLVKLQKCAIYTIIFASVLTIAIWVLFPSPKSNQDSTERKTHSAKHIAGQPSHAISTFNDVGTVSNAIASTYGSESRPISVMTNLNSSVLATDIKPNTSIYGARFPNNKRQPPKKLFKNFSNNYISGLLRVRPGASVVGVVLPKNFDENFKESLSEPILIEPDDSLEDIEIKKMMKDIREQGAKLLAEGGSVRAEILKERESLRKVAQMRFTLQQEVIEMFKSGASDDQIAATIDAANKMMDEEGGEHIRISPFRFSKPQE